MLVKLEAGNPGEQAFTNDVASQVQHYSIIGAARDLFRCGRKVKLRDVNSAQQPVCEFGLIYQLLASFKRQRGAPLFLRRGQAYRQQNKTYRDCESEKDWSTAKGHLK